VQAHAYRLTRAESNKFEPRFEFMPVLTGRFLGWWPRKQALDRTVRQHRDPVPCIRSWRWGWTV